MRLLLVAAATACLSTCDATGPIGPRGAQGDPGEIGNEGMRLKPRAFRGPDGSEGSLGWRDDTLGFVCRWIDVEAGSTCASPETVSTDRYRDPQCVAPVAVWTSIEPAPKWWVDAKAQAVHKMADPLPAESPTWQFIDGDCVSAEACTADGECVGLAVDTFLVTVTVD